MRVVVVGAAGQLGQATTSEWVRRGHDVAALTRADLDMADGRAVDHTITGLRPDIVINCSAYTAVDAAEREPLAALRVNSLGVRALARAVSALGGTLVHYSTDFVFDGQTDRPYTEEDLPAPQSVYGMSKYLGEQFASEVDRHYVLRVESLFGGATARSSIDRMVAQLRAGQSVAAFADRTVSPSYVEDVISATCALIEGARPAGLYHCVNTGMTTWVGVAEAVAASVGAPRALVVPTAAATAPLVARRPLFAALSNQKLADVGVIMPSWETAVERYVSSLMQ